MQQKPKPASIERSLLLPQRVKGISEIIVGQSLKAHVAARLCDLQRALACRNRPFVIPHAPEAVREINQHASQARVVADTFRQGLGLP